MIYEWKHTDGTIVDCHRRLEERERGPGEDEVPDGYTTEGWTRIISGTSTPFEHLRDRGILERTHWKPDRKI